MNEAISEENCFSYYILDLLRLYPRFSLCAANITMRSKEWIPHAKLIELNEKIISWYAHIAWNIGSAEEHS